MGMARVARPTKKNAKRVFTTPDNALFSRTVHVDIVGVRMPAEPVAVSLKFRV